MLGNHPQDEDIPPDNPDDFDPGLFDFFGYGHLGHGPPPPPDVPEINADAPNAADWGLWPDNVQAANGPNNNVVDVDVANLVQVPIQGEPFLELNDLINQVQADDANDAHDFDLNQPLDDDLGGRIDDLIQAAADMEEEINQVDQEQVIAMDNSDDELDGQHLPNPNNANVVEVFIPMDGDVPFQVIPNHVQEDELPGSRVPGPARELHVEHQNDEM